MGGQALNPRPEIVEGTLARTRTPVPGTLADAARNPEGYVDPAFATITDSVSTGYCVALVQNNTQVGNTGQWKAGTALISRPDIPAGTVIATFNAEGKYASLARGNHVAFLVEYSTRNGVDGIVIYDQYRGCAR